MKVRVINKTFTFYVGDHTRPMVERLVDASGNLSDEIWSIPIDAAAIRDAGVRCETCEHFVDPECLHDSGLHVRYGVEAVPPRHFFCAHWSGFAEGSK